MLKDLQTLAMKVESFLTEDSNRAGRRWAPTRQLGFSLGDRACLSLGLRLRLTVLTCDRDWAQLLLAVVNQLLR